uniref:Mediator of RNA polymerase II transcription subunit 4 n=1 Tax=Caenorhabditis tropicalis TaxID=1561998 RepID=A0A1I7TS29_9PELO
MIKTDERSLRDLLLESADDLEHVLKMIVDTLINRERSVMLKSGESVTNIIRLFDSKQEDLRALLRKVPEYQEREQLIRTLKTHVEKRDEVIQKVENNLKACEVALTRSSFHANQKTKKMQEAALRPVNSETLIKLSHQISKHNSVSAPLTWQMGDPSRPFPQEHEFRAGHLLNAKMQALLPQLLPGKNVAQKPLVSSPSSSNGGSAPLRNIGTPLVNSETPGEFSPRTGYNGEEPDALQQQVMRGATPNEKQFQNASTSGATSSQSPFARISQSPSSSPNVKLKITGLPNRPGGLDQVQEVRDVEQMSSDSSNSSDSSDDEGTSKKTGRSNKS